MKLFSWKINKPPVGIGGKYYASHPDIPGINSELKLLMNESGVDVKHKKELIKHYDWNNITGYNNEFAISGNQTQRITATRMLTLGVFSLSAPKASGQIEHKFTCELNTTTGDIALEVVLEGDAGSKVVKLVMNTIKQANQQVREYVAEHATGRI